MNESKQIEIKGNRKQTEREREGQRGREREREGQRERERMLQVERDEAKETTERAKVYKKRGRVRRSIDRLKFTRQDDKRQAKVYKTRH